ncbi:MAG: hypothetical protein HQK83_14795, partial [Fibrobacteria bacterium]|nr:hypothetical protein [Fibrobacteria bacterium]
MVTLDSVTGEFSVSGPHTLFALRLAVPSDTVYLDSVIVEPRQETAGIDLRFKLKALLVDGIMTVLSGTLEENGNYYYPAEWVVDYGQGRVFNAAYGNISIRSDNTSMRCAGMQTMLIRGAEWAATGIVSYDIPQNFPTSSSVSENDNISVG